MQDVRLWVMWLRANLHAPDRAASASRVRSRDERGFTAVEWLFVVLGVIVIAGIAVAAVQSYVTGQTNKLGKP